MSSLLKLVEKEKSLSDIITINVRGAFFQATRGFLTVRMPKVAEILHEEKVRHDMIKINDTTVFIERDVSLFRIIFDRLIEPSIKSDFSENRIKEESTQYI